MDNSIKCPHCQQSFTLDEALKEQIEKAINEKAVAKGRAQAKKDLQLELSEKDKNLSAIAEHNKQLGESYSKISEELRQARKENASQRKNLTDELELKLAQSEKILRQEILDETRLKDLEKDKKLADATDEIKKLKNQVNTAGSKLEQNLNQLQGEVLELDLEERLRRAFPYDEIQEVKKFHKGADVTQIVKNSLGQTCGLILWEAKNALWKKEWLEKLKQDMGDAKANIAVLVSQRIPDNQEEIHAVDNNLWIVRPRLAVALASTLRSALIEVYKMSQHSQLKDSQMKSIYDYIISPEFKYRIESMLETYDKWRSNIDTEKKWFSKKWSRQEKMLDQLTMSIINVHSDFQGITNDALLELGNIQLKTKEIDFDKDELDVV
ncbi:MAG: DUF2130 domain-containing protein [Candidatus Saccharibacteria bacterium]|nr:DUF2130 domain-containing protein [Candidatus Saccharibacteria bacterium]